MRGSVKLGRIFGIPFAVNYSWFLIFAFVTISLGSFYFPHNYPHWHRAVYWVVAVVTSILFFASIVAHELSHSFIAIRSGVPVKSITLFIFGGVAQISRDAAKPTLELVMAAAGPLSSLVLSGIFTGVYFATRSVSQPVAAVAGWLAIINASLAIFNLIPGFPLDGGRVFRSILWWTTGNYRKATHIASLTGQGVAYLFIFGGILTIFVTGNWANGLWFAFIGWFLLNAAEASWKQAVLKENLQGFTARDLMSQECTSIPPDLTVDELISRYIIPTSRRCFMVTDGQRLAGIVTLANTQAVPRSRWPLTHVEEIMVPRSKLHAATADEEAVSVIERMDEEDVNQIPVVEDGHVVGMIGRDNVIRFIRAHT